MTAIDAVNHLSANGLNREKSFYGEAMAYSSSENVSKDLSPSQYTLGHFPEELSTSIVPSPRQRPSLASNFHEYSEDEIESEGDLREFARVDNRSKLANYEKLAKDTTEAKTRNFISFDRRASARNGSANQWLKPKQDEHDFLTQKTGSLGSSLRGENAETFERNGTSSVRVKSEEFDEDLNDTNEEEIVAGNGMLLKRNSFLDVQDLGSASNLSQNSWLKSSSSSVWRAGQVLDIKKTTVNSGDFSDDYEVLVGYLGWSSKWDEWINVNSGRIKEFRSRTSENMCTGFNGSYSSNSQSLEINREGDPMETAAKWLWEKDPVICSSIYNENQAIAKGGKDKSLPKMERKHSHSRSRTRNKESKIHNSGRRSRKRTSESAAYSPILQDYTEEDIECETWMDSLAYDTDSFCIIIGSIGVLSIFLLVLAVIIWRF